MPWLRGGLSVAIRSSIAGAVLGGLLGAVVARTDPIVVGAADPAYVIQRFGFMLGMWGTGGAVVGLVTGFVLDIVGAICTVTPDAATNHTSSTQSKRSLRAQRFWRAVWVSLPIAACLSLIAFWRTYGAYQTDGFEYVGWPLPFFTRGGCSYAERYDLPGLIVDVGAWIGITAVLGLVMRYGAFRLSVKVFRFLRGRP